MMMKPLPKAAQSWRELFADPNQAAALSQSTWQRWQNYQALSENLLIRQARLARDIWACACRPGFDLTLWQQQSQLQKAVLDRVAAQQAEGARELFTILLGAGRTRQANTVSKLMEGEYNFFAQLSALCVAQATAYMELAENAQVNSGYLLSRQLEQRSCAPALGG